MNETLEIIPEIGVPFPNKYDYQDLRLRVEAACNTASYLESKGAQYGEPTRSDKEEAVRIVTAYAEDEKKATKQFNDVALSNTRTESVRYARELLDEYGHRAAENATQIRNLVTTRLIHEADNADPKVRLKALELLGKISDVGLFSDKTEITVTHQTSDELKNKLKSKLEKLINPPAPTDEPKVSLQDIMQDDELQNIQDFSLEGEYEEVPDKGDTGQ